MPDTAQSSSSLIAAFADQTTGAITAQDMRNLVLSYLNTVDIPVTAFAESLLASSSASAARTALGLGSAATVNTNALTIAESQVTNLVSDLAGKAPLASGLPSASSLTGSELIPLVQGGSNVTEPVEGFLQCGLDARLGEFECNNISSDAGGLTSDGSGNLTITGNFDANVITAETGFAFDQTLSNGDVGNGSIYLSEGDGNPHWKGLDASDHTFVLADTLPNPWAFNSFILSGAL